MNVWNKKIIKRLLILCVSMRFFFAKSTHLHIHTGKRAHTHTQSNMYTIKHTQSNAHKHTQTRCQKIQFYSYINVCMWISYDDIAQFLSFAWNISQSIGSCSNCIWFSQFFRILRFISLARFCVAWFFFYYFFFFFGNQNLMKLSIFVNVV